MLSPIAPVITEPFLKIRTAEALFEQPAFILKVTSTLLEVDAGVSVTLSPVMGVLDVDVVVNTSVFVALSTCNTLPAGSTAPLGNDGLPVLASIVTADVPAALFIWSTFSIEAIYASQYC
jgi:hypothetical protein